MWSDRQMDRNDKANSHFLQFCEWAQKCICMCVGMEGGMEEVAYNHIQS